MKFLFLLIVVALFTAASGRKQRARRQESGSGGDEWQRQILKELFGNDSDEEAWPKTTAPMETSAAPAQTSTPAPKPAPISVSPRSTAAKPPRKPANSNTSRPAPSKQNSLSESAKNAKIGEIVSAIGSAPANRPATEQIAEEFDLRRAVIYSEILRPKFEEDNF